MTLGNKITVILCFSRRLSLEVRQEKKGAGFKLGYQVSCDEDISRHTRQQLSHSPSPSYSLSFFATLHVVSVRIGKNCALCLVYRPRSRPRAQFFPIRTSGTVFPNTDLGHSFSQYGPPFWWIIYMYIYISTSPNLFSRICMAAIGKNYEADIGNSKI